MWRASRTYYHTTKTRLHYFQHTTLGSYQHPSWYLAFDDSHSPSHTCQRTSRFGTQQPVKTGRNEHSNGQTGKNHCNLLPTSRPKLEDHSTWHTTCYCTWEGSLQTNPTLVILNNYRLTHWRIYYGETQNINPDTVHWESFSTARSKVSSATNIFITKWLSNTAPTGKILKLRQHCISSKCPRCNTLGEDREHVLTCWGLGATSIWEKGIQELQHLLDQEATHPDISQYMIESLRQYRISPSQSKLSQPWETWKQELQAIGWLNILSGLLGRQVISKQQEHYHSINSRKTGKNWGSRIILQLWTLTRNMWYGRNAVKHNKQTINHSLGVHLLDIEIEREYDAGYQDLPATIHKWYQPSKEEILSKSVEYKKGWLVIVKSVKESMQEADYGIFASSHTLRKWVGLQS